MVLLIIADDFTGALDTGVQFAARGIKTRVVVGADAALTHQNADVLVVDTETRHLPAAQAYAAVEGLVQRAKYAGFAYLYKKTDSALRGNVGAELAALLSASSSRQLAFLPAFPQMNRVTKNGVQYIDGACRSPKALSALTRSSRCATPPSLTCWPSRLTCPPPVSRRWRQTAAFRQRMAFWFLMPPRWTNCAAQAAPC